jgi:hypothetical protein
MEFFVQVVVSKNISSLRGQKYRMQARYRNTSKILRLGISLLCVRSFTYMYVHVVMHTLWHFLLGSEIANIHTYINTNPTYHIVLQPQCSKLTPFPMHRRDFVFSSILKISAANTFRIGLLRPILDFTPRGKL